MEEKVEEKKHNSTVIESCLLPFERNESGIKQKHRIQTKTKTKILYCFRICLGNNCLTVFCVILKSRVCSTALFCTTFSQPSVPFCLSSPHPTPFPGPWLVELSWWLPGMPAEFLLESWEGTASHHLFCPTLGPPSPQGRLKLTGRWNLSLKHAFLQGGS